MTSVKLSAATVHYPHDERRRDWLEQQTERLDLARLSHTVCADTDKQGLMPTTRRAWDAIPEGATHHLMLQDDMLPCEGFTDAVLAAIAARPNAFLNFFSMRGATGKALAKGLHWTVSPEGVWGAYVMPVWMLRDFLAWEAENIEPSFRPDDRRLALYAMRRKLPVYNTAPCLVQHVGAGHSLRGNSNRSRLSKWFADDVGLPDSWTGEALRDTGTMSFRKVWDEARRRNGYHTALSWGAQADAQPVTRAVHPGGEARGVAIAHDLIKPNNTAAYLPPEYETCDVLYAEPAWKPGFAEFDRRAGIRHYRPYEAFANAVLAAVESHDAPAYVFAGKHNARLLDHPEVVDVRPVIHNGEDGLILCYRKPLPPSLDANPQPDTTEILQELAEWYERVGDFCCGYGRTGRAFLAAGKSCILSDHNAKCIGVIAAEWAAA